MIERLRELNPNLKILNCTDALFERYGRTLVLSDSERYCPFWTLRVFRVRESNTGLPCRARSLPAIGFLRTVVFGGLGIQAGVCAGRKQPDERDGMAQVERGRNRPERTFCSSWGFSPISANAALRRVAGVRVLPAARNRGRALPFVLHFAPVQADAGGFRRRSFSRRARIFTGRRGTNDGGPLLRAREQMAFVAHAESRPAAEGALVGIAGDNPEILTD
jgi:hypothetical protein